MSKIIFVDFKREKKKRDKLKLEVERKARKEQLEISGYRQAMSETAILLLILSLFILLALVIMKDIT